MPQQNPDEKVFVFERLKRVAIVGKIVHRHAQKGDIEYRFGYFIVGKNGNKKGKWIWGQCCPLIRIRDFVKLLKQAKERGVIC